MLGFDCGETISLQHARTGHSLELLVEPVQRGVMLARPAAPYHRLHRQTQAAAARLTWRQTSGNAAAAWDIVPASADHSGGVLVRGLSRKDSPLVHLSMDANGALVASQQEDGAGAVWLLRRRGGGAHASPGLALASAAASFARDGYVVLPGLVPPDKVARALRLLNHHLGSAELHADVEADGIGMEFERAASALDAGPEPQKTGVVKLGSGRRCTCCLAQAAPLLALLGPRERSAIGEAVGAQVSGPCGCQVALRFPLRPFGEGVLDGEAALPSLLPHAVTEWHTDAAKYNEKKCFDVVAGIFLNEMQGTAEGNLWVQPGSQARERKAREAGQLARRALHSGDTYSHETATPITAAAPGTVIIFDKDLVHAGGPNLSPAIRYALYFRLRFERMG